MANGSHPTEDKRPAKPTLGDRVRRWVDEFVEEIVDGITPQPIPVPIRRPIR